MHLYVWGVCLCVCATPQLIAQRNLIVSCGCWRFFATVSFAVALATFVATAAACQLGGLGCTAPARATTTTVTLCNWRHRNVAVLLPLRQLATGNLQLGTGSLIAVQALTSLWRWQDLICLAHNLSKSLLPHPFPHYRANVASLLQRLLVPTRSVACSMLPEMSGVPKPSSTLLVAACCLLALDCRLSCAADSAHPKLRRRWHVALGCAHPHGSIPNILCHVPFWRGSLKL